MTKTSAILFSGGWDSVAVALKYPKVPLIFFNYDQIYFEKELSVVMKFSMTYNRSIFIPHMKLGTDCHRRNFFFCLEARRLGFLTLYSGSRNILPFFDKYKDSNFWTLKKFGRLIDADIKLPLLGWSKKRIVNYVRKRTQIVPYNCYLKNKDYKTCLCVNCVEMRSLLK